LPGRCCSFDRPVRGFLLVVLWIVLSSGALHAFTKYAGEAFSLGVGARALGMGSAFVSMVGGTSSLYWNPAGMSWGGQRELLAMHAERFGGAIDYDFLGYSQPLETQGRGGVLGLGLIRLGVSGIVQTAVADPGEEPGPDNVPFAVGTLGTAQYQFLLGYATELKGRFRVGGNVKLVYKDLSESKGTGFGFDLGAIFPLGEQLSLGIVAQDVPTTFVAFDTGRRETTAPTLRVGVSLNNGIEVPGGRVTPAVATSVRFTNRGDTVDQFAAGPVSMNFHIGGEYRIGRQVALRGGLDEGTPTAGGGVLLGDFAADYAWFGSPNEGLQNTHRVSIGFYF
jgi:hypothetical protein